jgi:hypothetical protein
MKNAISASSLDTAIAHALFEAGLDNGGGTDNSTRSILAAFVEHVEKDQNGDGDWWQAMLAVVDPFIELTAAVVSNPLGDNSEAAKTALKSIEIRIQRELEARAREQSIGKKSA